MVDILLLDEVWGLADILGGGRKEKEVNRLCGVIMPYIAENL